jgi:iron complex outermembrane recepter protein
MKKSLFALSVAASVAMAETYSLGQVSVQSSTVDDVNMIEQSVSSETIAQNNEHTIAETLDNVSGISLNTTGARSETKLSIRGFNANRVGVFIDGIPVYVPYDGNFDYGRFLTNDIAQVDISKGYSSIAYGANTMGGVINIISKKPSKELEGNIRAEMILDSDAKLAKHVESINIGTRLGGFYAQLSGVYSKRDHFRLSDDYTPVAGSVQPKGERLRSYAKDQKISLKAGYVADDWSEVAINYANQQGRKYQPPSVDEDLARVRFWDWPYWDKETISASGQKNFENSYIKALAFYDVIENSLYSYADETYSSFNDKGFTFKSRYDDYSYGARLEYGLEISSNFLKVAANYKKDVHRGYNIEKFSSGETLGEQYEDTTYSLGIEDEYTFSKALKILAGVSYDRLEGDKIYDTNTDY